MNIGTLSISGRKFRLPCVYEFKSKGVVLYVGRSDAGFSRAFDGYKASDVRDRIGKKTPRKNGRTIAFNECDEIRVTVFDNTEEARQEEIYRIGLLQPAFNIQHKTPPKPKPIPKVK